MRAVVFDIYGTLLDEKSTTREEAERVLGDGLGADFARTWDQRFGTAVGDVVDERSEYIGSENLRRKVLSELLAEYGLEPEGREYDQLKDLAGRYRAYADAPAGLGALAEVALVVGLTNTDLPVAAGACARAGLRWHTLLSTQFARTFKPHPEAYGVAERELSVVPDQSLFVAAHPFALRAAAQRGYTTVFLPRPDTGQDARDGEFDHVIASFDELVALARD